MDGDFQMHHKNVTQILIQTPILTQECIPAGCVPPAHRPPRGDPAQGGYPLREEFLPRGVSAQGGGYHVTYPVMH